MLSSLDPRPTEGSLTGKQECDWFSPVKFWPHFLIEASTGRLTVLESAGEDRVAPAQSASADIPADWSSQSRAGREAVAAAPLPLIF